MDQSAALAHTFNAVIRLADKVEMRSIAPRGNYPVDNMFEGSGGLIH